MPSEEQLNKKFAQHLVDCYTSVKVELGEKFEPLMAELTAEISTFQSKCNGISFSAAATLLTLRENDVKRSRFIKAAIVWYTLEQNKE